jgi:hypothetical protein
MEEVDRQLRCGTTDFMLLVGFANPFSQGAHRHIQIIGNVLDAACTSLPDFAQGLLLEFN